METSKTGKTLRLVAIILVGLNAAMNLLGGIGTTCAAFFTKEYPPMWSIYKYQWLYQAFVVIGILVGLAGIWTVIKLVRGGKTALRDTLIVLVIGAVVNTIHVIASLALRGAAAPANVVLGLNVIALLFMLYLGTPGMRKQVRFDQESGPSEQTAASGMAAIIAGVVVLSTPMWAGPTHMFQGQNWVDVLLAPLYLVGGLFVVFGVSRLVRLAMELRQSQAGQPIQAESTSAM